MAEDVRHVLLTGSGVAREVPEIVGNFRPRRCDEVLEHGGDQCALVRRQRLERPLEMLSHDRVGPAQPLQRLAPERARAGLLLDIPESLQHELKERRLHPPGLVTSSHHASSTESVLDPSRRDLIEHRLDQLRLRAVRLLLGHQLVQPLQGADDCGARGDAIEVVEPEVVCEEVRDSALEEVELRERILADPEQDVHAQSRLCHELR
jgi:hypothetical protein